MSDNYLDNFEKIEDRIYVIKSSVDPFSSDVYLIQGDKYNWIYDVGDNPDDLELLKKIPDKNIIISHFHRDHLGNVERLYKGEYVGIDKSLDFDMVEEGAPDAPDLASHVVNRHNIGDASTWDRRYLAGDNIHHGVYAGEEPVQGLMPYFNTQNIYASVYTHKYTRYGEVVCDLLEFDDGVNIKLMLIPSSHAKGCLAMLVNEKYLFAGDATYPLSKRDEIKMYNVQHLKNTIDFLEKYQDKMLVLSHDKKFSRPVPVIIRQLKMAYGMRKPGDPFIITNN